MSKKKNKKQKKTKKNIQVGRRQTRNGQGIDAAGRHLDEGVRQRAAGEVTTKGGERHREMGAQAQRHREMRQARVTLGNEIQQQLPGLRLCSRRSL
jgi:hypothetical protein